MKSIERTVGTFRAWVVVFVFLIGLPALAGAAQVRPAAHALVRFDACPCYSVLHYFGASPDGQSAEAPLTYSNGLFYGTTTDGGSFTDDDGTIFNISPSGVETILHDFSSANGDANTPVAGGLLNVNGTLYGSTFEGGSHGRGTVYSLAPSGVETVLHSFGNGSDGRDPIGGLVEVNGELYGTTYDGGANHAGTVFGITPGGKETVLYNFAGGTDGARPWSTLIEVNGELYGTTTEGGTSSFVGFHGFGTVFKITTGGAEKLVHSFGGGDDGRKPFAGLVALNGILYGTTSSGGAFGGGTVFGMTLGGVKTMTQSFNNNNCIVCYPGSGSLAAANGTLYGTTNGATGAVFSVTPAGVVTVLHTFVTATGSGPFSGVVVVNRVLYGAAALGGHDNRGVIYSLQL